MEFFKKIEAFGFVVPDDRKFGTDIFVSKKAWKNARNNDKVVVKILKYPEKGKNAEGEILEVLGKADEAGIDMLSLVKEYNLPYEFPIDVLEEARKIPNYIEEKEISKRADLRNKENMHIFTIDGEDAKDLDDAVCVRIADNRKLFIRCSYC